MKIGISELLVVLAEQVVTLSLLSDAQLMPLKGGKARHLRSWSQGEQLLKNSNQSNQLPWLSEKTVS